MPTPQGRILRVSRARRMTADFLAACQHIPTVAIGRTMDLRAVQEAREAARPRPSWSAILIKAYALAAAAEPALRRAWLSFPRARLYEHPENVASVVIEREVDGEPFLFLALLERPETLSLAALDEALHAAKEGPIEEQRPLRRTERISGWPKPLRRLLLWWSLEASARQRVRHFGTFGVTSVAGLGADSLRPLSPWATLLHHGVIDGQGVGTMRLTFDHRVMDGTISSRALAAMEDHLNGAVLAELEHLRPPS